MMMVLPRRRGGSWTPASLLGGSHRGAWISAGAGVFTSTAKTTPTADGGVARAIQPQAGTFGDMTAASDAASPTLRIIGDITYLEWDGSADLSSTTDASFVGGPNAVYMITAFRAQSTTPTQQWNVTVLRASSDTPNNSVRFGITTIDRMHCVSRYITASYAEVSLVSANDATTHDAYYILECYMDESNLIGVLNNGTTITGAHGWGATQALTWLGVGVTPFGAVPAKVAEIFVRDSLVTGADRTTLQNYMAARVGVTL